MNKANTYVFISPVLNEKLFPKKINETTREMIQVKFACGYSFDTANACRFFSFSSIFSPALCLFHFRTDSWIEECIQNVDQQIHKRNRNRNIDHTAHNRRDVRNELLIDDVTADPFNIENLF